jgi:hypothetical protein
MTLFGFRLRRTKVRPSNGEPPKKGGIAEAVRRSPLVGADIDLSRKNRWDDLFYNGPRVSADFMSDREPNS